MTLEEATIEADRLRRMDNIRSARIERILPEYTDPIKDGDNGWDVVAVYETVCTMIQKRWSIK